MNFINQLGVLAFGTRLRLLTDKFINDAVKVYQAQNIDFEPRWFAMFYLLYTKSPLSISEITTELGYTQPAVTQIANILIKKRLVKITKDRNDSRRKMLTLSSKGLELLPKLKNLWEGFSSAIEELFIEINCNLLYEMEKVEIALQRKDMLTRVSENITPKVSVSTE